MPDPIQNLQQCECGSDKLFIEQHWQRDGFRVICEECDRLGHYRTSPKSAIISWNAQHGQAEEEHPFQKSLKMILSEAFGSEEVKINYLDDTTSVRFVWKETEFRAAILSDGKIMVEEAENMFLKSNRTTQALELFLNYVQDHEIN